MRLLKAALILFLISFYSSFLLSRSKPERHEYQLDLYPDSVIIYDGTRIVGTVPADSINALLLSDNQ